MNFKKAILSTTCLVLLSSPVHAGWDQNNEQKQFSGRSSIQIQLERLERENEQLRNAISQMRKNVGSVKAPETKASSNDVRIQALIEENKRLIKQLNNKNNQSTDKSSVNKIYSLNQDNDRLQVQINALRETNGRLLQEKSHLQKQIEGNGIQQQNKVDTSKYRAQIKELSKENKLLNEEITRVKSQPSINKNLQQQVTNKSKEISALENQIVSLREDKASLSAQLSNAENKNNAQLNAKIIEVNERLSVAQTENETLRQTKERLLKEKDLIQKELDTQLATKKIDTTSFETRIADLERQNSALKANENKKAEELKGNGLALEAKLNQKNELVKTLEGQISVLKKEKFEISSKLSEEKSKVQNITSKSKKSDKVAALELQNQSLRDTIKAQTSSLTQHDNAIKRAEALTSENIILKQQLEFANTAKSSNDDTAQNLIKKNKELIAQVNDYKQQIDNIDGLKETIRALRIENDRNTISQQDAKEASTQIIALEQQNKGLEEQLKKERASASTYRAELGEYQKQLESVQANQESDADQEEALTTLRLENQELKARIDLLSSKASKTSVVFKKEEKASNDIKSSPETLLQAKKTDENSDVRYIKGKTEVLSKDINVVETSYPKVDKVKPLLDDKGKHIYKSVKPEPVEAENIQANSSNGINAEDLLSQELKPLTGE